MVTGQANVDSGSLLERVYTDLDLDKGNLIEVTRAQPAEVSSERWRDLGDWLLVGARARADRLFFVNGDPVLVFSSVPTDSDDTTVLESYRRAWSLARPHFLFLAVGNELRVYSLANPPPAPGSAQKPLRPLNIVQRSADVFEELGQFHRARLESAAAFEDDDLFVQTGKADQQLLQDVRAVTADLVDADLQPAVAHALIERAILIRYLEDRAIITDTYFDAILATPSESSIPTTSTQKRPRFGPRSRFIDMLSVKDATYSLFEKLSEDFNGDLFVVEDDERELVTEVHLRLLQELFQGTASSNQLPLFLWAYDFSVVPTNLISSMYEMFLRDQDDDNASGVYYTPPSLAELVLSEVLDETTLNQRPKILDPACGSGIFLVEAFRRIVRHESVRAGGALASEQLRDLLLHHIAGCDIDPGAVRLAAFGLYIAYLNYQTPQDIQKAGPLPPLIHKTGESESPGPLVVGDAFWPFAKTIDAELEESTVEGERLPWAKNTFDVIVGNPPWTQMKGGRNLAGC